jgi:hypothetical protein
VNRKGSIQWDDVITTASMIVQSYDTGVTLRQLFYRLVSSEMLPNTIAAYKGLSHRTAIARREGWFPSFIDNTRRIREPVSYDGSKQAMETLIKRYRRDRTEFQEYTVYVAVEKNALAGLLSHWFNEKGIPVLAFGGYPSQTFVDDIINDVQWRERDAVLIYAGDFDATGVDILRDFLKRTEDVWRKTHRIALNEEQIAEYKLPPLPGKHWDPRAAKFEAMYGKLVQVELDALAPDVLKKIYDEAIDPYWDDEAFDRSKEQEEKDRAQFVTPAEMKGMLGNLYEISDMTDDRGAARWLDKLVDPYMDVF